MEARVEKGGEACTKSLEDSGCSEVARQAGFREGPPSQALIVVRPRALILLLGKRTTLR